MLCINQNLFNHVFSPTIRICTYSFWTIFGNWHNFRCSINSRTRRKNNISTIEVKTKKVPVHFKGEKSTDFEEKIKKLIENEFRVDANHIREGLTNHICLSNCKKVRNEICSNCKEQIFGYLFKKISAENNDKFYCELCSTEINEPMFKIY